MNDTIQYDPTKDHFDVVIVGAGIAGAMMAHEFAAEGKKVVILEAGLEYGKREDQTKGGLEYHLDRFYAANAKVPSASWRAEAAADRPTVLDLNGEWQNNSKHYMIQKGPLPFSSTFERISGGTANHWLGTSLRLVPNDFKFHSTYHVPGAQDWPIAYQTLEPYYSRAEKEMGVSGNHEIWKHYLEAHRSQAYPMSEIAMSYLDETFKSALDGNIINGQKVTVMSTPQARNSRWYTNEELAPDPIDDDDMVLYDTRPPCMGNTSCIPICPVRAKYDPSVHLNRAIGTKYDYGTGNYNSEGKNVIKQPANIRYQSVAYQIDIDASTAQVSGILFKQYERISVAGQTPSYRVTNCKVTGKIYVICAHAIETAKLLLNSEWKQDASGHDITVANSSDQVGRNLMDHTILLSWALAQEPVYPFRGPLSTSGIGDFRDGANRDKRAAYVLEIGNDGWSWPEGAPFGTLYQLMQKRQEQNQTWYGRQLRQSVHDHVAKQVRIAVEFESLPHPDNRVVLSKQHKDALGIPKPQIHYDLSDYTKRGFEDAVRTLTEIWANMGATDVHIPVANLPQDKETNPFSLPSVFRHKDKLYEYRGAGHIMGTFRMGDDNTTSVVNSDCRTHDHDNLYLVGSGVFPSSGTANPTLTIAALALRAAVHIKKLL